MESAIPRHLQCPRTRNRRVEDSYAPPYPSYVGRADPAAGQVVMGYFGVQWRGAEMRNEAYARLDDIVKGLRTSDGPGHYDLAHYLDARGFDNLIAIGYWRDTVGFARWRVNPVVDAWWTSEERLHDKLGYFREIAKPHVERFETLFNTPDRLEGVGVVMGSVSGEIQEHAYWGGARDRIPLSQTDALQPSGSLASVPHNGSDGRRVKIAGHENVALIRSGQEWTEAEGKERALYLNNMEPVLREGMDFLQEQGVKIGCYSNRYMTQIDKSGDPLQKSFGLSYWRCLADMERWSESHPTHVAIFGTFMRIVQELQFRLKLRFYHEVSILKATEQEFEYINCHPNTGILNAAIS